MRAVTPMQQYDHFRTFDMQGCRYVASSLGRSEPLGTILGVNTGSPNWGEMAQARPE